MNKKKLLEQIISNLNQDLVALRAAARATYEAATGEESIPENQYDTRALEASYLAGAQAARVAEIEHSLSVCEHLPLKDFDKYSKIESTALVDLDFEGKPLLVFLVPTGGSLLLKFEERNVQVITPHSPLGQALLGLRVGDIAIVEKSDRVLEYEVKNCE